MYVNLIIADSGIQNTNRGETKVRKYSEDENLLSTKTLVQIVNRERGFRFVRPASARTN